MVLGPRLDHVDADGKLLERYQQPVRIHDGQSSADVAVGHELILNLIGAPQPCPFRQYHRRPMTSSKLLCGLQAGHTTCTLAPCGGR